MEYTRYELEVMALARMTPELCAQHRDTIEEVPTDELERIIAETQTTEVFQTGDGYLLVLHGSEWTNGDFAYQNRHGHPWDDVMEEPVDGVFVTPDFKRRWYDEIMETITGSAGDLDAKSDKSSPNM